MKRAWLFVAGLAAALGSVPAVAAEFPVKPVTLVLGFAPGGPSDVMARILTKKMEGLLKQPVVIENRAGAGGGIAANAVARAAPDGHTILLATGSSLAINVSLYKNLGYDPEKDFEPISLVGTQTNLLYTHPGSVPAKTLAEFTAWAKPQGDKLSYATDPGSAGFLAAELYKQLAGVRAAYIPYKGSGPASADVLAGHVPYMWSVISIVTPHVRSGKMKGLAIAAEKRAPGLPDVPTTAEAGMPDFAVSGWYGLLAPAKTPKDIVDKVHAAAAKALKDGKVLERLAASGSQPIGAGPAELDAHIRREIARWDKVLRTAGIQLK